jgi:hypothetical protein
MTKIGNGSGSERQSRAEDRSGAEVSVEGHPARKWTSDDVVAVWHMLQHGHHLAHRVGQPCGV